jgi:uncharacterized glyoxalase superfamily protein PhnB
MACARLRLHGRNAYRYAERRHARSDDAQWSADHDGTRRKAVGMASPHETGMATMGVFVYINDVDKHHLHAAAAGAEIVQPPHEQSYGRTYTVRDLEGHPWFFTTPSR